MPYIIFQLIYTLFYFVIGKENGYMKHLFYPQWSLWFLLSLFCWHVMLIIYKRMKPTIGISLAVLLGLLVGYIDFIGHHFSLSRTFVFFPFFLLGYWLNESHVQSLKRSSMKLLSIIITLTSFMIIYFLPDINTGWLLSSKSYHSLGYEQFGSVVRLLVYSSSTLMTASILSWIPKRRFSLTTLGERTVYVYLFHGFIIQMMRQYNVLKVHSLFDTMGIAIVSFLIVWLLSNRVACTILQPLVELKATRLRRCIIHYRESQHY